MNIHTIALYFPPDRPDSFAEVEGLMIHCHHIQKQTEVVLTLNPNITDYQTGDVVETTWGPGVWFVVADIYEKQVRSVVREGKKYEIELLTWSRPEDGVLRFDFEVRVESAPASS